MKNKGFTLVELLAIIIVLGVITSITISVVTMNIENTKENSFEVSAKNLLDASKEFVTKNMENHDFPKEGISANLKELGIENNPFISGIIKRNENGQIVLVDVTDGTYCVNGTKTNLTITKDDCSKEDETKAELKLKVLDVKATEAKIMIKTYDGSSGIDKYKYCLYNGKNKECNEVEKDNERNLVKEIIKLENLNIKTKYRLEVEVINGSSNEAIKVSKEIVEFETKEIAEPTFKLSSNTYATEKELIITYPNVEGEYKNKYKKITEQEEIVDVNIKEARIKIDKSMRVIAYIEKDNEVIVENSIIIEGIDLEPPIVNVTIPDIDKWTTSKTITINARDEGVGVALRPYSYDNGKNWQKTNKFTFSEAFVLKAKSRDRLGNINSKFTVNDDENEVGEKIVPKVDSEGPKIIYEVIEGSKESKDNEWYSSNKVVLKVTVIDEKRLMQADGSIVYVEDGIGVNPETVQIISDNKNAVIEKVTDTVYTITMASNGTYNIKSTAADLLGNQKDKYYTYTIKKDDVQPVITAKSISHVYYGASEKVTDYFNISKYGVAGGKTTCYYKGNVITNNNQLERGINTVTCKMVGTNGKKAEANVVVKHKYNAKVNCNGGRTVSGGDCTYHYSSNCGQCGDYCAKDHEECVSCTKKRPATCTGTKSETNCRKVEAGCKQCYYNSFLETNCKKCGTLYNEKCTTTTTSYTYDCEESYTDSCCSTKTVCDRRACSSCTKTENGYRYYTCEIKGNNNSTGSPSGSVCYY